VVLAPLKEQARIVQAIKAHQKTLDGQEAVVEQSIQRTRTLRHSLLVRAVEGKLVEQDETEGSSAEHLAEIQAAHALHEDELKKRRKALKGTVMAKRAGGQTLPKRDLHEVLTELGPLPTQDLFKKAGYRGEKPDEAEAFYRLLDKAIKLKRITAEPGDSPERTRFKAVKA
jgi:type I restriction enzyme S subunit